MASVKTFLIFFLFLFISITSFAQLPFGLIDGREHKFCESCRQLIVEAPKEVLYGCHINSSGEIYFSMSDGKWFEKIFRNDSYGVMVDIVSKDRYTCGKTVPEFKLPLGTMLPPVYRKDLLKKNNELMPGQIYTMIGKLPVSLKNKEVEANLVIVNGNYICYYTNFLDIDRSAWKLLPMGLFTDTLINIPDDNSNYGNLFAYKKTVKLELPFEKSTATFSKEQLKKYPILFHCKISESKRSRYVHILRWKVRKRQTMN